MTQDLVFVENFELSLYITSGVYTPFCLENDTVTRPPMTDLSESVSRPGVKLEE